MQRIDRWILGLALAAAFVVAPASADEVGGSGFEVPQGEWLWGVEGLQRTPVDLSIDIGASFRNYEQDAKGIIDVCAFPFCRIANTATGTTEFEPEAIEGGFRIAGGIGYWLCCVMIEPAMAFRANRPFGNERTSASPTVPVINNFGILETTAEIEVKEGWDIQFGPQLTWMLPQDTPLVGGLPLVFFPYIGISHIEWDVEVQNTIFFGFPFSNYDRDFEDDALTVGFDLDLPLPGAFGNFTHAITVGFRWLETNEDHDMGPTTFFTTPGTGGCAAGPTPPIFPSFAESCFNVDGLEGWRVALLYRITWNDFSGFFTRNIFGPVD